MQSNNLIRAGLLTLILSVLAALTWEFYLRFQGVEISYDDNEALFSNKRAKVYEPASQATVFIGSSRIKFDLDIPTWQSITGNQAIQLAKEGNSPRPILEDLANDTNFKGRLVVDVTEGLFFSLMPYNETQIRKGIKYYHGITPTQKASFQIDRVLESSFVFLDQDYYSFNALLSNLKIPPRAGVFVFPDFPFDFNRNSFERQSSMTSKFVSDTSLQNKVKGIWKFFTSIDEERPIKGDTLQGVLNTVKAQVDKIRSRGGEVIFVRTPCSGEEFKNEMKNFPRAAYWDRLLSTTGCQGIHYLDYPAIADFECPESSHLSREQAVVFTKNFIKILREEKGWPLNNQSF